MSSPIVKHKDSHVDHNLTDAQLAFVLSQDPKQVPVEVKASGPAWVFTVAMPAELGTLPCALYGPREGDHAIPDSDTYRAVRGNRKGDSRMVSRPIRYTSLVTIVAGPHDGHEFVLFTSYGGSAAPREPFEFADDDMSADAQDSRAYWAHHALSDAKE